MSTVTLKRLQTMTILIIIGNWLKTKQCSKLQAGNVSLNNVNSPGKVNVSLNNLNIHMAETVNTI
jgi:hypothetical protein